MRTLVLTLALLSPLAALADDEAPAAVKVVQRRQYQLKHELAVTAGFLPLDAFYKGLTVNASYTYHFFDFLAWRVGRFAWSGNFSTGLRRQLEREFGVQTTEFQEVKWFLGSDVVVSPFYGKVALFNALVVHLQLYLLLGGDAVSLNGNVKGGLNLGGGIRFFLSQYFSLKVEAQNHFVFGNAPQSVVDLQLGLAVSLGGEG